MKFLNKLFKNQTTPNIESQESKKDIKQNTITLDLYAHYPEHPYINPNRDIDTFLYNVKHNKAIIVPQDNMIRDDLNLLPGDIYLIFWLFKHRNQQFPMFFETFFGIDVQKEIQILQKRKFIDSNLKVTPLGCEQIDDYAIYLQEMKTYLKNNFKNELI